MISKLTPEDIYLWQSCMKDVKPLPKTAKPGAGFKKERRIPSRVHKTQKRILGKGLEPLSHSTIVQPMDRKKLRRIHIEARLDLHGFSLTEAYQVLQSFIRRAQEKGLKTVLIITGKGSLNSENTLRQQVPRWFEDPPLCGQVAFRPHPAKPQDGGGGAFYVMLKRK